MDASQYKKHSHREHILELPDTYIGSVETSAEPRWVYDAQREHMVHRTIQFNPGLYKTFDELVVNARDALVRSQGDSSLTPVKRIEISTGMENGHFTIRVKNDGDGIPIELHPTEKVYIPEMIFGHLLTSSNYNKDEEKIVGGKNGYGAKLASVFSNRFTVLVRSPKQQQMYKQVWEKNMSVCHKPSITKDKATKGFVEVVYEPDLARFRGVAVNENDCHEDMKAVFHTRAIEIASCVGKDVRVDYNGVEIKTDSFDKFIKLFLKEDALKSFAFEKCGPRWEIGAVPTKYLFSDDAGTPDDRHISFVNGINTRKGGKHVETVQRAILEKLCTVAKTKKKMDLKPGQIKDSVTLFISAVIVNPSFDSQTKETLTTPSKNFGSSPDMSDKIIDGLVKAGILEDAQNILDAKTARETKKTDGSKKRIVRVKKLDDAEYAGTAKSLETTLILTEGDSAKTSAVAGLKVIDPDRKYWGVFPLRGKLLNVKDISRDKFNSNEEIVALKEILGLKQGMVYKDLKELRYGRIMIMSDQDVDGFHIRGLIMNLFHSEWPSLLQHNFVCCLMTPLLKCTKGKEVLSFYSESEYEEWRQTVGDDAVSKYNIKYYKGLGTSSAAEACDWFRNMHNVVYCYDENTNDAMDLAFNKKRADDRKQWLASYDPKKYLCIPESKSVPFSKFVHEELIHFSNSDNLRSLPSVIDGLKPSQRKVLYGCLKRHLSSEVKVSQLAGYISEHTAYHHGEASLNDAIINMAQVFVGTNNIHLLEPIGQFGSRLKGGQKGESAAPRYIFTKLNHLAHKIFRKEDNGILESLLEDGMTIEPVHYNPILPMVLVNGALGIGTGFSTFIPQYNPLDIVRVLKDRLHGTMESFETVDLVPWYIGFKGTIQKKDDTSYSTQGLYEFQDETKSVFIHELPVGTWSEDYKEFLFDFYNGEEGKKVGLKEFKNACNDVQVKITLYFEEDAYMKYKNNQDEFVKTFKLVNNLKTSNMCAFDESMNIVKFSSVGKILEVFYKHRLEAYRARRSQCITMQETVIQELDGKARFIQGVIDGKIALLNQSDEALVSSLQAQKIPPCSAPYKKDAIESYNYVLHLRVDTMKKSGLEHAQKELQKAREILEYYHKNNEVSLWLQELDEFTESYNLFLKNTLEFLETSQEGVLVEEKKKKKKSVK